MNPDIWRKPDPMKNYFLVPNAVFSLNLTPGELAVYVYLLRCEDRKSHQCWPSYETIGHAVGMSRNTVRRYVGMLEERGLITTEYTTRQKSDGNIGNSSLCYTIRPIQEVIDRYHQKQLDKLELDMLRHRARAAGALV